MVALSPATVVHPGRTILDYALRNSVPVQPMTRTNSRHLTVDMSVVCVASLIRARVFSYRALRGIASTFRAVFTPMVTARAVMYSATFYCVHDTGNIVLITWALGLRGVQVLRYKTTG